MVSYHFHYDCFSKLTDFFLNLGGYGERGSVGFLGLQHCCICHQEGHIARDCPSGTIFDGSEERRSRGIFHSSPLTSREPDFYFPDLTYSQLDTYMKDDFDETVFDVINPFEDERSGQTSPVEPVQSSNLAEQPQNRSVIKQAKQSNISEKQSRKAEKKKKDEKLFPFRLHELASSENFQPLNWAGDGTLLSIDLQSINDHIKEICRTNKFSSFLRQLHIYGFRKVSRNPPKKRTGTNLAFYRHSLFLEHSPELLEIMYRIK